MKFIHLFLISTFSILMLSFISLKLYNQSTKQLDTPTYQNKIVYFLNGFTAFINQNYKDFIPYEIKNDRIITDQTEYVRNIATMYDIMQLQSYFYTQQKSISKINDEVIKQIENNANLYVVKYQQDPFSMRQASAFLALLLHKLSAIKYQKEIEDITDFLYAQLNNLEKQFELGEVLMALSILNPRNNLLNQQIDKIIKDIEHYKPEINHIFEYNWLSKFILAYDHPYSKKLFFLLYPKVMQTLQLFTYQEETNYIAVAYECLASLYAYNTTINALPFIQNLTTELTQRYNPKYGLFAFINGDMRLDITGHIINGFICFDSANNKY